MASLNGGLLTLDTSLPHLAPTGCFDQIESNGGEGGGGEGGGEGGWGQLYGDGAEGLLPPVHGVMLGRAAWHAPWEFRAVDTKVFGCAADPCAGKSRRDLVDEYVDYAENMRVGLSDWPPHLHNTFSFFLICSSFGRRAENEQ